MGFADPGDINPHPSGETYPNSRFEDCFDAYIPVDQSTYTPVPRNDDAPSLFLANLGFTFSFCGSDYTSLFINTNGNLSFGQAVAQYSPDGFPYNVPMIAPFWGDVDTRNVACGQAWYQLNANYLIVSWEEVGWYNSNCDPLNTFQVIISDGTAPIIGVGNNIQFRYGDMEWTTGTASGGGPFGGFAATVGYNSGDNVNYDQVGRFNVDGSNYDGPEGANDGVHWLDFKCFSFDASGGGFTLECNDITRSLDGNCNLTVAADEVASSLTSGCNVVDLSITPNTFSCDDLGPNVVTITATSGGQTETCTAIVNVLEGLCSTPLITPIGPFCEDDFPTTLSASPPGGTWGGAAPSGTFDPSVTGPGLHTVTYTNLNTCPTMTSIDVFVNSSPQVTITPDPPEFCEDEGGIPLTANASGGDGNYSYEWTTPIGNQSGQIIAATFPGLYSVSVTDGNGCAALEFTNVVVNPSPDVFILGPFTACNSEVAVQLQGSPTGGIWTGTFVTPDGFIFPENMPIGTTQVTYSYTNNFFCESSVTADITILPSPDALAFNNGPYCEGQDIELFGSTNAPGVILYNWTGPNGYSSVQQNPTDATEAGVYGLEVTASGCSSEIVYTYVDVSPAPDAIAFNTGPYCPGQTISLNGGTTQTGLDISYEWEGPNGYVSFEQNPMNATDPGLYTLVVTVDGCPSEATATLVDFTDAPDALAENTGPYCVDEAIILIGSTTTSGTIITYSWSGPNGYSSNFQNPTDASEPGQYTLEIVVDGCTSNPSTTEITINPLPEPIITGDDSFCLGASSILDAGSGYATYQWSTTETGQNAIADEPGIYSVTVSDINGCTGEATYNVTENPNPVPSISGSTSFCTGSATLLDAGGGYDFYEWSNGLFTQSISVSEPGDYSVVVTDINGCTGTTSVTVIENDLLSPNISGDLNLCEGDVSILDAGDGFDTYIWSTGDETSEINATITGDYSVTVTDINGCTGETTVSLVVNTNPTPTIDGELTFCEGETNSISADGPYDLYEWSEGSGTQSISVDATGTYFVTVTDQNGCTGETSFDVTETPNPQPTIIGDNSFCSGSDASLDGGAGYDSYAWSDGSTTQTISVSTGDTYILTVTDANGCTGETQFTVDEIIIQIPNITGVLEFCEGSSTLDAGDGYNSYEWSTGSTDQTISISQTGDYSVTVTEVNGCTAENEVSATVFDDPTPEITGVTAFCEGEISTLDAGAGYVSYEWSDGTMSQFFEASTSGTYSVTITDSNGCTGEDDINIIINPNPTPTIAGSTTFCSGFSTILDASEDYETYLWSDGSENSTLEVSTGGTYTVLVTDANGCTGEASIDITESTSLNPVISGDIEYCEGSNTVLDAGAGFETYEWSNGSLDQTITVNDPNDYTVTVTDVNGCSGETTVSIIENSLPTLNITGNNPICTGDAITLDAGTGFENYEWSDLSLNQSINVTEGGTYSVIVTDVNGCTNEASVTVIENPLPEPVIIGNQSFCSGETVSLNTGIFDQYLWSDGSELSSIDITNGGTYSVTVTDLNGCTGEDQITVSENQLPTPQISGTFAFCEGNTTSLSGPDGFDYLWSTGETSQSIVLDTGGDIGLTVTDAFGCSGETSVSITENQNPEPSIAGSSTFCIGNSSIIDAGMGYENYSWSDGSLNQTLEVTIAGIYEVTVTDINGCTGTTQFEVTESSSLEPVIIGDADICAGEESTLDAGAGFDSYIWSNGAETQSITVDATGNYSVTVSDTQGCSGENTLSLTVNQNPLAIIDGIDNICEGETSTLDAGSGFDSYLWSNGETTQFIDVTDSGIYSVIITDANGCQDESQIDVLVNPNPSPIITGPSSFCSGNTATLDAGNGYDSYLWSNGETSQIITVDAGDTYSVVVSTLAGCTGTTELEVIENSSLTPVVLGDLEFCDGDNSILDAGSGYATYEWSTGETSQTITVSENGNYGVLVTDADGCSGSSNVSINLFDNPEPIIAGSSTFCTGSFTTLDAGNYSSFLWSNGETSQTITVNTPGAYEVEVIDENGCSGIAFVDITESTSLNPVISGEPAICTGGSTILDAGAGFDTYLWSDGSMEQTLEVSSANDFTVTVSDAQGCTGETTISIIENTPPSAQLAIGPELCNTAAGGSITNLYDFIVSGDNTGTWEDTDNSGALGLFDNLDFNGIVPGDYTFTYTTNSALSPCDEVSYPIIVSIIDCACPDVFFTQADPLCNGDGTLSLNDLVNSQETGTWQILTNPVGTNPAVLNGDLLDATGADIGTYELQFSTTNMPPPGCPQSFNITVDVESEVFAGLATAPSSFCEDEVQTISLGDLLNGEEPNGIWTETSVIPSQNGAFHPGNGSFNMTGQMSGVYSFEYSLTSTGACPDDTEEVMIIVNETPTAIAGSSIELSCGNPTLSLNATGSSNGPDFDIQWSGGVVIDGNENSLSPTVNQAGFYTLIITNTSTGCSASDVVEVTESADIPNAFAGEDDELTCSVDELSLEASGDIGNGFEVEWSGPSITMANMNEINPMISLAGIYTLTITNTDNGCVSSVDTVIISNNDQAPNLVIQTPLSIDCNNNNIEIIGTSPIDDVTFEWLFDGNTVGAEATLSDVNEPGFYTLVVTNTLTGCSGSETIEVFENTTAPSANAGLPQLLNCFNTTATLDGSGSQNGTNISWAGPGIVGNPTTEMITVNLPGVYIITVQDPENGCTSTQQVSVDQDITPPNAVIIQPDQLDCTVDEVTLDGAGSSSGSNYNYSWIDPQGNILSSSISTEAQSIGNYILAVQDINNGCVDTATVLVSQNMDVPNSALFQINNPDCFGDDDGSIAVSEVNGGMSPYIFSINDEVFTTNGFYNQLPPGAYEISLQDANGCEWDTLINILEPVEANIDLGANLELELGDSATISVDLNIPMENVDTIIWSPAELIECGDPDCLEVGFSSFLTQNVSATLIDTNGCIDKDEITVFMNRDKRVFVPNVFTPNGDGENDLLYIFADDEQVVEVKKFMIFNRWGELVFEGFNFQPNDPDYGWNGMFRGEMMNPAVFVYLAEIEFIDGEVIQYKGDISLVR